MGEFLQRLFDSDFMPHGHCWRWDPWVVWSNAGSDAVIFACYLVNGFLLIRLAALRQDRTSFLVLLLFGAFIIACGCTHALEVYNIWHGAFRLAGVVKAVTALLSLMALVPLMRVLPKVLAAPALNHALAMDAALSLERREKQRMVEQLRQTQDRFQLLVEGIYDYSIITLDRGGLITSWNSGAERIYGYRADEVLGGSLGRFFSGEERAAGKPESLLRRAAADGRIEDESWRIRKDGTRFLANVIITPFRDAQGQLLGFSSVARDITEQRANQTALQSLAETLEGKVNAQVQELRESEARLQGFVRHASTAIAFKGLDGRYLLINPRMEALVGRPAGEILGHTLEELFPEEVCARAREGDQRALRLGQDSQVHEHWIRNDGKGFDLIVHKFPLVDGTGQCWGMGIISTDITQQKQADLALLQSQKLESLGVLAGGIAHDFNNLLGAMQGHVELAQDQPGLDQARPHLATLGELMAKASGLIRQMLAYAGHGTPSVRTLDLNQLVQEMTHLLGTSISKKALVHLNLHPGPLPMAADPSQIQQVVMNLVINASEALGEQTGVITITTRLEELCRETIDGLYEGQPLRPGPHAALEVADNGAGMTAEMLTRIFDPFFTTKFAGRGLGLAAVHGIVRGHQGGIRVYSEPGKGSVFKLLFPAEPQAPAAPGAGAPRPGTDADGDTILVVDDEDEMRSVVVLALRRAGFQTLQARDGMEALNLVQRHQERIRLILMDLTMPTMDGEEACRELRRRGSAVPVLLSSGFNEAEALTRFEDLGLAGFIQKPFSLRSLVERVRSVLAG